MSNNSSGSLGFAGALTILFIGLKLGKVIDWSWWWVLSPLWISTGIALITLIILAIWGISLFIGEKNENRTRNKRISR